MDIVISSFSYAIVAERRNYKHVFDGLLRVYREEGVKKGLLSGASICMARATVVTVGQVVFSFFRCDYASL